MEFRQYQDTTGDGWVSVKLDAVGGSNGEAVAGTTVVLQLAHRHTEPRVESNFSYKSHRGKVNSGFIPLLRGGHVLVPHVPHVPHVPAPRGCLALVTAPMGQVLGAGLRFTSVAILL